MSLITDSVVAIQRLTRDSDNVNKESYQSNMALQAIKCQIQPASPEFTAIVDGVYGQTFLMFTTQSGILEGDKITVSGVASVYRVKGIEDWSQIEGIPHYEIVLLRWEEEL